METEYQLLDDDMAPLAPPASRPDRAEAEESPEESSDSWFLASSAFTTATVLYDLTANVVTALVKFRPYDPVLGNVSLSITSVIVVLFWVIGCANGLPGTFPVAPSNAVARLLLYLPLSSLVVVIAYQPALHIVMTFFFSFPQYLINVSFMMENTEQRSMTNYVALGASLLSILLSPSHSLASSKLTEIQRVAEQDPQTQLLASDVPNADVRRRLQEQISQISLTAQFSAYWRFYLRWFVAFGSPSFVEIVHFFPVLFEHYYYRNIDFETMAIYLMVFNLPKLLFLFAVDNQSNWYVRRLRKRWLLQPCAFAALIFVPLLLCAYAVSETATAKHHAVGHERKVASRSHRWNSVIAVTFLLLSYGYMGRLLRFGEVWTWVTLLGCYALCFIWVMMWCVMERRTTECIDRMKMGEIDLWRRMACNSVSPSVHQSCIAKIWQLQGARGICALTDQQDPSGALRALSAMLGVTVQQVVAYIYPLSLAFLARAVVEDTTLLAECPQQMRADRAFVKALCLQDHSALRHATPDLRNDRVMVLDALDIDARALGEASEQLRHDIEFLATAVRMNPRVLQHTPWLDRASSRQLVLDAMTLDWTVLKHAPDAMRSDIEVMLLALQINGHALQYASASLRDDPRAVWAAVQNDASSLQFASKEQQADRGLVLAAVRHSEHAFQFAAEQLRADRQFVKLVVVQNEPALQYASAAIRADKQLVMEVIKQNGHILKHVAEELTADRDVVLAAVAQDGHIFKYAAPALQRDPQFVLAAVKLKVSALEHASDAIRSDQQFIGSLVDQDVHVLKYASDSLRDDRHFMSQVASRNGRVLEFASDELRSDAGFVLSVVEHSGFAIQYASIALQQDPTFMSKCKRLWNSSHS